MKKVICFSLLALSLLSGCWPEKEPRDKGIKQQLYLLDVNTKEVYNDCHIPGAMHVSFDEIEDFAKDLDKNADLVVYCSNYRCTTSGMVVKKLKQMGFKNVKAYEAGIAEWHQQERPTQGACSMGFLTMKVTPPKEHDSDIEIISTDELAQLIEKYKKEGGIAKW